MATATQAKPAETKGLTQPVTAVQILEPRLFCKCPRCKHNPQAKAREERPWFKDGLYVLVRDEETKKYTLWVTNEKDKDGKSFSHLEGRISAVPQPSPQPAPAPTPGPAPTSTPATAASTPATTSGLKVLPGAKMFPGIPACVYLVAHPDIDVVKECLDKANKPPETPVEGNPDVTALGEPLRVTPVLEARGEDKKPRLVIGIDEPGDTGPAIFHPAGHENYKYLCLYGGMPNSGCLWVREQLVKLQVHLGALRYPIGNHAHPYYPALLGSDQLTRERFDALTYNCVLAFVRDCRQKKAVKMDVGNEPYTQVIDFEKKYDSKPLNYRAKKKRDGTSTRVPAPGHPWDAALNHPSFTHEYNEKFRACKDVSEGEKTALAKDLPAEKADPRDPEGHPSAIVDQIIGEKIKLWLDKGYRKAGHVLLSRSTGHSKWWWTWYRDDMADVMNKWSDLVKQLGVAHGIISGHTFRDSRDAVTNAPKGKASLSIHKTGLASDLTMGSSNLKDSSGQPLTNPDGSAMETYRDLHPDFPIHYVFDPDNNGPTFRLYGKSSMTLEQIEAKAWELDLYKQQITYKANELKISEAQVRAKAQAGEIAMRNSIGMQTVTPWVYDPSDPGQPGGTGDDRAGGKTRTLAPDAGPFVDLTQVARECGLHRIHAWASDWVPHDWSTLVNTYSSFVGSTDFPGLVSMLEEIAKRGMSDRYGHIMVPGAQQAALAREMAKTTPIELKKVVTKNPTCALCNKVVRKGEKYYLVKKQAGHPECVEKNKREGETIKYPVKPADLDAPLLRAYANALTAAYPKDKTKWPNPDVTFTFGDIPRMNEILGTGLLGGKKFLVWWHDSTGVSEEKELEGNKLQSHLIASLPWKVQLRPFVKVDKAGKVLKADQPYMAEWIAVMKERGLEAGAMGVIEVELVQLEDVAALLATRFTDKSVLVKVIDAAGKCNLKAEQEVKCKTAATDLLKLNSWKIGVRPFLGKDRPLRIGCTFFFIAPGIARTIEWWHYQYQAGVTGKWSERMADIGWTNEGLRKVGYSEKQLGNAAK